MSHQRGLHHGKEVQLFKRVSLVLTSERPLTLQKGSYGTSRLKLNQDYDREKNNLNMQLFRLLCTTSSMAYASYLLICQLKCVAHRTGPGCLRDGWFNRPPQSLTPTITGICERTCMEKLFCFYVCRITLCTLPHFLANSVPFRRLFKHPRGFSSASCTSRNKKKTKKPMLIEHIF